MAEYIERGALIAEIEKAQSSLESNIDKVWYRNKPYFKGLAWANRLTRDAPAADVVEVRHGEWVEQIETPNWLDDDVEVYYKCSICGCYNWGESAYCPNCGAKMGGKGEGE